MSGEVRVSTPELRTLAGTQHQAVAEIGSAVAAAQGVGASMAVNHGVICAGTTAAVRAAEQVRSTAGTGMQAVSGDLAEKLTTAASSYDQTDQQAAGNLGEQMPPH